MKKSISRLYRTAPLLIAGALIGAAHLNFAVAGSHTAPTDLPNTSRQGLLNKRHHPNIWVRQFRKGYAGPFIISGGTSKDRFPSDLWFWGASDAEAGRSRDPDFDKKWHRFSMIGFASGVTVSGIWRVGLADQKPEWTVQTLDNDRLTLTIPKNGLLLNDLQDYPEVLARLSDGSRIEKVENYVWPTLLCESSHEALRRISSDGQVLWEKTVFARTPQGAGTKSLICPSSFSDGPITRIFLWGEKRFVALTEHYAIRLDDQTGNPPARSRYVRIIDSRLVQEMKIHIAESNNFDLKRLQEKLSLAHGNKNEIKEISKEISNKSVNFLNELDKELFERVFE